MAGKGDIHNSTEYEPSNLPPNKKWIIGLLKKAKKIDIQIPTKKNKKP